MDLVFRTKKRTRGNTSAALPSRQRPVDRKPKASNNSAVGILLVLGLLFLTRRPSPENLTITAAGPKDAPVCPADTNTTFVSLQPIWKEMDQIVAKHPESQVSGGIFLYPRQTALIAHLVQSLAATADQPLTVCETGFGAGHSAALFLGHHIHLHLFDLFDRPYQLPSLQFLQQTYPHQKIQHYPGNSCRTVPQQLGKTNGTQCDVLHASSLCRTDNIDLVEHSPCGVLLTTTAMNSLEDNVVYFGPKGQWTQLLKRKCIRDITCFEEDARKLDRTYVFDKGGATISHKFCFAITTGKCQKEGIDKSCDSPLAKLTQQHLKLPQLCPSFQVPIPMAADTTSN